MIEDIFLKVMLIILKNNKLLNDLPFLPERVRVNKYGKIMCNLEIKKSMLYKQEI